MQGKVYHMAPPSMLLSGSDLNGMRPYPLDSVGLINKAIMGVVIHFLAIYNTSA